MMKLAMGTLTESMEMLELFEEEKEDENKEENKENAENIDLDSPAQTQTEEKKKTDSSKMVAAASVIGIILGLGLSFALFFWLPTFISTNFESAFLQDWDNTSWVLSLMEGALRLIIFVLYILLVSQMKDIKRTFEYHGAEHMSIFAYERGDELTVENVRKHSRFHPRCGTSFLIVMILIGVIVGLFIPRGLEMWQRVLIRFSLFPLVIGLGFEFLRFAGKHIDNIFVKILSAPGMWVQRLSTKKPDDEQLEVAIVSLKSALKLEDSVLDVPQIEPEQIEQIEPEVIKTGKDKRKKAGSWRTE
jgi:uncharacterized protein YqhQ